MAFGTITVNVDFDEDSQDRIHIAAGIANQFGSFLIGVAGWALRGPNDPRLPGMDYRTENAQTKILERLDQLKATFQHIAGKTPRGTGWRSSTGLIVDQKKTRAVGRQPGFKGQMDKCRAFPQALSLQMT
jgi:hypothetical protein